MSAGGPRATAEPARPAAASAGRPGTACCGKASETPRISLREKQKIRTRKAIREAAMTLFAESGYTQTTVEGIAREAEVSHTTFFRYFQTKEQVVISDDLDEEVAEALAAIPPGLGHFDLLRHVVEEMFRVAADDEWASNPERLRLLRNEPILAEAHKARTEESISETTEFFAEYLGVPSDDFALGVFIGAAGGVVFRIMDRAADPRDKQYRGKLLDAIDLLEKGLPLGVPSPR